MAKRKKKINSWGVALSWVFTFIFLAILSASMFSVFNNQFQVSAFVWVSMVVSVIAAILLIKYGYFTTNETLAFK